MSIRSTGTWTHTWGSAFSPRHPHPSSERETHEACTGRSIAVAIGAAFVSLIGACAQPAPSPTPPIEPYPFNRRNILLIIADDIGVDKVSPYVDFYNSNARTDDDITVSTLTPATPTLQKLCDAGVMFVNAWGCPTCSPTRASVYTGLYPPDTGVYTPGDSDKFCDGKPTTIAAVLTDYESGLFGKWHLGEDPSEGPVDVGWDAHQGFLGGEVDDYYDWEKVVSNSAVDTFAQFTGHDDDHYTTAEFVRDAAEWIEGRDSLWMATVAFNAAHAVGVGKAATLVDQQPPDGCGTAVDNSKNEDQVYRATVECMDSHIAWLLAEIDEDVLEDTTIVFLGDNGTERGRSEHFTQAKGSVYEGGVNVPLIIADGYAYLHSGAEASVLSGVGRVVNPGRVSEALVQAVDLFVTFTKIANADGSSGTRSVSLIPLLLETSTSVRSFCYAWTSDGNWAVRGETYKLIYDEDAAEGETRRLFDLSKDRWEQDPLLSDSWTRVQRAIATILANHMDAIGS